MIHARIDLEKTSYAPTVEWRYLTDIDTNVLNVIYRDYCRYKKFASVMPIFNSVYQDPNNDVIGYYHQDELVAFSIIRRFDDLNAECMQFAWNYQTPRLRMGIESLKTECSIYKQRGFQYLYLGEAAEYKGQIKGFEILGPI